MAYLNTRHIRRITGATARQLDYWQSKGLLTPSGTGKGERNWRDYTIDDAILARTIKALREEGVSLNKIEEVLKKIAESGKSLRTLKLAAYGGDVYINTSTKEAIRAADGQSTFLFIDMQQIGLEVGRKLSQLGIAES